LTEDGKHVWNSTAPGMAEIRGKVSVHSPRP